jgi:hypothetical protein
MRPCGIRTVAVGASGRATGAAVKLMVPSRCPTACARAAAVGRATRAYAREFLFEVLDRGARAGQMGALDAAVPCIGSDENNAAGGFPHAWFLVTRLRVLRSTG